MIKIFVIYNKIILCYSIYKNNMYINIIYNIFYKFLVFLIINLLFKLKFYYF